VAVRVSRHRFPWEQLRSDDDDRLFNPPPPVASSPLTLLPASSRKKNKEEEKAKAQGKGGRGVLTAFTIIIDLRPMAGGKRPRDEESSAAPRGLPRVCREFFLGRYFSTLSPSFRPCILPCYVRDDACVVVGCRRWVTERGSRDKVVLGRLVAPESLTPLHRAGLRRGVALKRLLLPPVPRLRPPSRRRRRSLRRRRSRPLQCRACPRRVRPLRPPPPRNPALGKSTRTYRFCSGSVT
jgi:hypothetical protein